MVERVTSAIFILGFGYLFVTKTVEQEGVEALPRVLLGLAVLAAVASVACLFILYIVQFQRIQREARLSERFPGAWIVSVAKTPELKHWLRRRGTAVRPANWMTFVALPHEGLTLWRDQRNEQVEVTTVAWNEIVSISGVITYIGAARARVIRVGSSSGNVDLVLGGSGRFGTKPLTLDGLELVATQLRSVASLTKNVGT